MIGGIERATCARAQAHRLTGNGALLHIEARALHHRHVKQHRGAANWRTPGPPRNNASNAGVATHGIQHAQTPPWDRGLTVQRAAQAWAIVEESAGNNHLPDAWQRAASKEAIVKAQRAASCRRQMATQPSQAGCERKADDYAGCQFLGVHPGVLLHHLARHDHLVL